VSNLSLQSGLSVLIGFPPFKIGLKLRRWNSRARFAADFTGWFIYVDARFCLIPVPRLTSSQALRVPPVDNSFGEHVRSGGSSGKSAAFGCGCGTPHAHKAVARSYNAKLAVCGPGQEFVGVRSFGFTQAVRESPLITSHLAGNTYVSLPGRFFRTNASDVS